MSDRDASNETKIIPPEELREDALRDYAAAGGLRADDEHDDRQDHAGLGDAPAEGRHDAPAETVVMPAAEVEKVQALDATAPTYRPPAADAAEAAAAGGGGVTPLRVLAQVLIVGVLLAAGVGVAYVLLQQKTAPAQADRLDAAPAVRVLAVDVADRPITVVGYGEVRARDRVQVVPQVEGRVVETNPDFVVGGTLPGGSLLLRLDPTDADLAVRQQEAEIRRIEATIRRLGSRAAAAAAAYARAQTTLAREEQEAEVAVQQYERLNPGQQVPPLVAREPQLNEARAALEAAGSDQEDVTLQAQELEAQKATLEAVLERARVDRQRTEVRLPGGETDRFRVTEKNAEVGQFVTRGQSVGAVYDAAALEVPVPLTARQLQRVELPDAPATLAEPSTGRTWVGVARRTEGEIDPRSRLTNVVVTAVPAEPDAAEVIADADPPAADADPSAEPTGATDGAAADSPEVLAEALPADLPEPTAELSSLVPGLFVRAELIGRTVPSVAAVPRLALRAPADGRGRRTGGTAGEQVVYVARPDDTLSVVPVQIEHLESGVAFVRGLPSGTRVILTDLDLIAEGMPLTVTSN